jgi:hypothetical protein
MGHVFKRQNSDGSVNLKRDYLTAVVPRDIMTRLREGMVSAGLIECDNQYVVGKKSFSYRIGPALSGSPYRRVDIDSKTVAAKRIKAVRNTDNRKITDRVHIWLRQQLSKLTIDMVEARRLATTEAQVTTADLIDSQQGTFSVCDFGRVHSPLTRLETEIRQALRLDGKPVIFTDLANSQPLFLALLMLLNKSKGKDCIKIDSARYHDLDDLIASTITPFPSIVQNSLSSLPVTAVTPSNFPLFPISEKKKSISLLKPYTTTPVRDENEIEDETTKGLKTEKISRNLLSLDQQEYIRICEEGRLYETIMDRAGLADRGLTKEMMFSVLFSSNHTQSDLKKLFKSLFPNVDQIARVYKKHDNSHLPKLLQRLESSFFIHRVCRRIMDEFPAIPVVTIHDSIGTTVEHIGTVEAIIAEEFSKLGLTPTLRRNDDSQTTTETRESETEAENEAETVGPNSSRNSGSSQSSACGAGYRLGCERLSRRPLDPSIHPAGNHQGLEVPQTPPDAVRRDPDRSDDQSIVWGRLGADWTTDPLKGIAATYENKI